MIAQLLELAKWVRESKRHGEELGLGSEETAFYDALAARRPYRDAMPTEKVFGIMQSEGTHKLDARCLEALTIAHRQGSSTSLTALASAVSNPVVSKPKETLV